MFGSNKKYLFQLASFYLLEMMPKTEILRQIYQSHHWKDKYSAYDIIEESLKSVKVEATKRMYASVKSEMSYDDVYKKLKEYCDYYNLSIPYDDLEIASALVCYPKISSISGNTWSDIYKSNRYEIVRYLQILKDNGRSKELAFKMVKHFGLKIGNNSYLHVMEEVYT